MDSLRKETLRHSFELCQYLDEAFPAGFCGSPSRHFWELLDSGLAAEKTHTTGLCTSPQCLGCHPLPSPIQLLLGLQIRYLISSKVTQTSKDISAEDNLSSLLEHLVSSDTLLHWEVPGPLDHTLPGWHNSCVACAGLLPAMPVCFYIFWETCKCPETTCSAG